MRRALASAIGVTVILIAATFVWAGGMGGGMGGGMMGGGGHMMDSFGNQQMRPGQRNDGYYDRDGAKRSRIEQQRAQQVYDRDMRRLDREISAKEQALNAETQKGAPDGSKIEKLRQQLSDLEKRYDDRRAEFESEWEQDDRQ